MSKTLTDIDKFHRTNKGKLVFGLIELLLACLLVSQAINSGNLWQYILAVLLFIGGLNNLRHSVFSRQGKANAKKRAKKR